MPRNPSSRPNPLIFHILHHVEPLSNFSPHSPPLFQSHPLRLAVHQVDLRDRCVRGYEIAIHPRISSGIKWPRIGLRLFHGWPVVAASLARPPLAKGSQVCGSRDVTYDQGRGMNREIDGSVLSSALTFFHVCWSTYLSTRGDSSPSFRRLVSPFQK